MMSQRDYDKNYPPITQSTNVEAKSNNVEIDSTNVEAQSNNIEIDSTNVEARSNIIELDSTDVEAQINNIEIESNNVEAQSNSIEKTHSNSVEKTHSNSVETEEKNISFLNVLANFGHSEQTQNNSYRVLKDAHISQISQVSRGKENHSSHDIQQEEVVLQTKTSCGTPSIALNKENKDTLFYISSTLSDTGSKSHSFAYDMSKDTILTEQSYYSNGYFNDSLNKLYARYMGKSSKSDSGSASEEQPTGCFDKTNESTGRNSSSMFGRCSQKQFAVISMTFVCMVIAASAATVLTLHAFHHNPHHYHGKEQTHEAAEVYQKAAVVTGSSLCTKIGADVLRQNGSAVDAAVAACFCLCVVAKHSTSIGGGGFILTYKRKMKEFDAYDFSATAPGKAKMDMLDINPNNTKYGGKLIAVPGLVKGLYEAWLDHGILKWNQLLEPAIILSRSGMLVQVRSHEIADVVKSQLEEDPGLRKLLLSTNREPWLPGHLVVDMPLAKTLTTIAKNPIDFYEGDLANEISKDVTKVGGFISLDDLANYKVKKRTIHSSNIDSFKLFTMGAPTGGPVVMDVLNILKGYRFSKEDIDEKDKFRRSATYHRLVEAIKFGLAHRTREGDPDFNDKDAMTEVMANMADEGAGEKVRQQIDDLETKEVMYYGPIYSLPSDEGMSQVSVIAPNGDSVSMTTTINGWFGSMYRSLDTGIIYNNQMRAFSTAKDQLGELSPSQINSIHAGKRPLTSISPIILLDKKDNVRFVLGGGGGLNTISAVAQVIINKLWFNDELGQALQRPRIFADLFHSHVTVEAGFDVDTMEKLQARKHDVNNTNELEYSAVQAIYVDDEGNVHAKSDPRKYGHTDGF